MLSNIIKPGITKSNQNQDHTTLPKTYTWILFINFGIKLKYNNIVLKSPLETMNNAFCP